MRIFVPLMLILGCKDKDGARPSRPGECLLSVSSAGTHVDRLATASPCGELLLDDLFIEGSGDVSWELFIDARQVVIQLTAHTDAVVQGLVARGSWSVAGDPTPVAFVLDEGGSRIAPVVQGDPVRGSWLGLVGRPGGGSVAIGALSARSATMEVEIEPAGFEVRWRGPIALEAGQTRFLDPIWLASGPDPWALEDVWAREVATTLGVDGVASPPVGVRLVGASAGDNDALTDTLELVGELGARPDLRSVDVVWLDDTWPGLRGDWRNRYPFGLAEEAGRVRDEGLVAGVSVAPLLVHPDAEVFRSRPELWVRDGDDQVMQVEGHAVLDITAPGASDLLEELVGRLVDDGFGYLVLDHLDAGLVEGQRATDLEGLEALRRVLDTVRRAAGDHVLLVARRGPLLPLVGLVDGYEGAGEGWQDRVDHAAALGLAGRHWWFDAPPAVALHDMTERAIRGQAGAAAVGGGLPFLDAAGLTLAPGLELVLDAEVGALTAPGAVPRGTDLATWDLPTGAVVLLGTGFEAEGPGGSELLTGQQAEPGPRRLAAGDAEIWMPRSR